jgi:hypothetical protein
MNRMILAATLAASFALSGCITSTVRKVSPEVAGRIAESLVARCGGRFEVEAGAHTGQLGGTADASFKVDANCPVPKASTAPPGVITTPAAPTSTIGDILAEPPR